MKVHRVSWVLWAIMFFATAVLCVTACGNKGPIPGNPATGGMNQGGSGGTGNSAGSGGAKSCNSLGQGSCYYSDLSPDCCPGLGCGTNLVCCKEYGSSCSNSADCCYYFGPTLACISGTCTCSTFGEPCDETLPCCSPYINNGWGMICRNGICCTPETDDCENSFACCPGLSCLNGKCSGKGTGGSGGGYGGGGNGGSGGTGVGGTSGSGGCPSQDATDHDGDGWSFTDGDCNDCEPLINPGSYDFVDSLDNDCSGAADDELEDCDNGLALDDNDPAKAAKAMELCRTTTANATGKSKTWGVIDAKYVKADGTLGMNPLSHGLLPDFGAAQVKQGAAMLALSSGTARAPNQNGYQSPSGGDMGTTSNLPSGYPKESPNCPGVIPSSNCYDPAALEIEIRVPTNVHSFSFQFIFYTYEFPSFICSSFNDFFVALLEPILPGLPDGNISFDLDKNPISTNIQLMVCKPQVVGGKNYSCPLGTALLADTGFDEVQQKGPHGATGWLQTRVPVTPGSIIKLRFAIWDSGDGILDSTVLIDNFHWSTENSAGPNTQPSP